MGMSFTNMHIRKNAELNIQELTEVLKQDMLDKGYSLPMSVWFCIMPMTAIGSPLLRTASCLQMIQIQKLPPSRIQSVSEHLSLPVPVMTVII